MLEKLARLGYASKAVIYAIIGVLAVLAVANRGGAITDTTGALHVVFTRPFGRGLLIVLAAGLCGYGAWRCSTPSWNPDRDGLFIRVGNAVRGGVWRSRHSRHSAAARVGYVEWRRSRAVDGPGVRLAAWRDRGRHHRRDR